MKIDGHTITYALLDSKPYSESGREMVRVDVCCNPACRGFLHTVMQFDVPAAVVDDAPKKAKKKDAPSPVMPDARDKAIRERVMWKVKLELGDVAKALSPEDLENVTA